jgi:GntR family transcriptional regulator
MVRRLQASEAAARPRVPKYLLLSQLIEDDIGTGHLRLGERLPSEGVLAARLPASLGTIQRALGALARRGLLVREHGRGTFVASPRIGIRDLWHFRFHDDQGRLLPVYVRVRSMEAVGDGPWSAFLGPQPHFVRLIREVDVDHRVRCASEFVVPGPAFPGLLELPLERLDGVSLREHLRERYGVATVRASEQVACETAPAHLGELLGMPPGSPALVCHILGYGLADAPIYHQRVYVPPDAPRLEVRERHP